MSSKSNDILLSISLCLIFLLILFYKRKKTDGIKLENESTELNSIYSYTITTIRSNIIILAIIPVGFFILSSSLQLYNFMKMRAIFPDLYNNKVAFESVVDFGSITNVLNYIFLNINSNINRLFSIIGLYNFASLFLVPFILFYKFKHRIFNLITRISILILFILLFVIIRYINNSQSQLLVNLLGEVIKIISLYFSSYIYCMIYIIAIESFHDAKIDVLNIFKTIDIKVNMVFIFLLIQHLILSIPELLKTLLLIEVEYQFIFVFIESLINIYVLILIPIIINRNYSYISAIRKVGNFVLTNTVSLLNIIIFYSMLYTAITYLKSSFILENYLIRNTILFIISFPIYYFSFFHFNYYILSKTDEKTVKNTDRHDTST